MARGSREGAFDPERLRDRAEELECSAAIASLPDLERLRRLVEDTRDHQIELQMKNEELGRTVAALESSRDAYRALFDFAPVGYLTHDCTGTIVEANASMGNLLGVSLVDLQARGLASFIHSGDWVRFQLHSQSVLEGNSQQDCELRFVSSEGKTFRCRLASTPAGKTGGSLLHSAVLDLTDRWRAEESLREESRRKDEFLAILAHELRNPLAPILSAAEILIRGGEDPATRERTAEIIQRQVRHMARLVDDLLDISRIDRGTIRMKRERLRLSHVVTLAAEAARPQLLAKQLEFWVTLPPEPLYIEGDQARLVQVLGNLLSNSLKFTPPGGTVSLSAVAEGTSLVIRVRDTGVGIPPSMLEKVFDMFTQAQEPLHGASSGLGIGLSLARRLVELHQGTICAHSEGPGAGTEMEIRLPLASQRRSRRDTPRPMLLPPPATTPRRLLIVDDNIEAAETLTMLLRMMGHEAMSAHSGQSALERAAELCPEVVLLDIGMPGMNGYEVARRLRALPGMDRPLLVALTGWGAAEDRRRAEEAGFDLHLTKPADLGELEEILRRPLKPSPEQLR